MSTLRGLFKGFDIWLFGAIFLLSCLGLVTMYTFEGENIFFERQIIWILLAVVALLVALIPDYRILRRSNTVFYVYVVTVLVLIAVLLFGVEVKGAQSRFDIGFFAIQPSEYAKIVLIAVLAKYFSKRHEVIGDVRHIIVSGIYALILFGLVLIQPDFGSAMILFFIWFGMVLVSGISFRHLAMVAAGGVLAFFLLWNFGFQDYQKDRIMTFLNPLADIQGTGYNAYQSTIAVGSGQILGKGVGYGTQSKLQYLPEYETDFIFAAFAEEWGIVGALLLFALFGVVIWRLLLHGLYGATNFERLFASGVAILIVSHFFVHIGMNIGLLPVTGTTVPFLSYGGSHLLTEFLAIGIVIGMGRYTKSKFAARELGYAE
ncbi:rod shape-determining protein RodA [Candidatus Kaiserbacteria bacterium]|nr:rod shape-determining protein RodA [Candidatus Kaiserbacteria bacterium]